VNHATDVAFAAFDSEISAFFTSGVSNFLGHEQADQLFVGESLEHTITSYPSPTQTLCGEQQPLPSLPPYISALPDHLTKDDIEYLRCRGCFTIPNREQRARFLKAYATWVHPLTPMLDLSSIIKAVSGDVTANPVSLLIFQSMMLAAAPFCDLDFGTKERKETRRILYERCKILHDLGIESDHLSIVQSTILMSSWDGDAGQIRDSHYWIGIATLHANGIGLYLDPTIDPSNERRQKELKRTWWSLLMRDRLLAVALRRPVQNKAFRFDVPMLQMEDFELPSLLETIRFNLPIDELDIETFEIVASCCMALAQLSEYIDKILSVQYSIQKTVGPQGDRNKTLSLVPKTTGIRWADITSCGQELQNWYGYLPEEVQQFELGGQKFPGSESQIIKVHKALLTAYYSMTLMTLYRPLLSLSVHRAEEKQIRCMAIKMVFQAAQSITGSFASLSTAGLLVYLPETATAAIEPAIVTHLLHSISDVVRIRHQGSQGFHVCWNMLLQLGDIYSLAETTAIMINAAAQKLKSQPSRKKKFSIHSADMTELVDELCDFSSPKSSYKIPVPFIGVVGDQREGKILRQWGQDHFYGTEFGVPSCELDFGMVEASSNSIGGASDADLFEQLVCWDIAG